MVDERVDLVEAAQQRVGDLRTLRRAEPARVEEDLRVVGLIPVQTATGYKSCFQFPQVWGVDSPHGYMARRLLPEVEWVHEVQNWTGLPVDAGARNAGGGAWKGGKGAHGARAGEDLGAGLTHGYEGPPPPLPKPLRALLRAQLSPTETVGSPG